MCDNEEIGDDDEVFVATTTHFAASTDHLSFLKGEQIVLLERIDDDVWQGESGTGVGLFNPALVKPWDPQSQSTRRRRTFVEDEEPWIGPEDEDEDFMVTVNEGEAAKQEPTQAEPAAAAAAVAPKQEQLAATGAAKKAKSFSKVFQRFFQMETEAQKANKRNLHQPLIVPSKCVRFMDENQATFELTNLKDIPPWPLIVFANPKSGGNRGQILMRYFKRLLNPVQVFDITDGGPEKGLKLFSVLERFRVLVCGGDGTVSWLLSVIDKLGLHSKCFVAILPLGTGNDLARVLGWGPGYDGGNVSEVLGQVQVASPKKMDRWMLTVIGKDGTVTEKPVNNYFSIGTGAKMALDFGEWRNQNQALFTNRTINKAAYALDGFMDSIVHSCKDLEKKITLVIGNKLINLPECEEVIVLNIPSYGGGLDTWGTNKDDKFCVPEINDELFEVVTVSGSFHLGRIKVGLGKGDRLAQGKDFVIQNLAGIEFPIQIDGEAEMLSFKELRLTHLNQVSMLEYTAAAPTNIINILQETLNGAALNLGF